MRIEETERDVVSRGWIGSALSEGPSRPWLCGYILQRCRPVSSNASTKQLNKDDPVPSCPSIQTHPRWPLEFTRKCFNFFGNTNIFFVVIIKTNVMHFFSISQIPNG